MFNFLKGIFLLLIGFILLFFTIYIVLFWLFENGNVAYVALIISVIVLVIIGKKELKTREEIKK